MPRVHKYFCAAFSALFGVAVFLFFALKYPYHIHYQEQYQLFEFSWKYFFDTVAVPGGFSDYISRFLTQFYLFSYGGAFIIAISLVLLQLAVFKMFGAKTVLTCSLSFVPPMLMTLFLCDENALLSAVVAFLIVLTASILVRGIKSGKVRAVFSILLVPVVYMLAGPLAIVYVVCMSDKEHLIASILSFALLLACIWFAYTCGEYPLMRCVYGIHYHRIPAVVPVLVWISAALCIVLVLISTVKTDSRPSTQIWLGSGIMVVILSAFVPAIALCADFSKEEAMKYDYLVRFGKWDKVIEEATRQTPDSPFTVSCLNLALGKTNRMDRIFHYEQNGPDGLFPSFERDLISPLPTAEIYYQLGMINTAQRYTFEAQEAIPDFQKSARCYKRLAETNVINGDFDVAKKYLRSLQHTLYYRKWAKTIMSMIDDGNVLIDVPEFARLSSLRYHKHDFLFSDSEMDSMLGLLVSEKRNNTLALDYLLSWTLLKKDLDRFFECFNAFPSEYTELYQQVVLLNWAKTSGRSEGLPQGLSQSTVSRFQKFLKAYNNGNSSEQMLKDFSDTYWYYYFYRFN